MTSYPPISIITVVYNDKDNLVKTIGSVEDITYPNYEFIVWDGGSTDGTLDVIKENEGAISSWHSEPDRGIYDAMNKAVKKAKGEWIYFLNAGDILFDVLDSLLSKMNDHHIIYGDSYWPKVHQLYNGKYNKLKILIGNICHQSIFYPRSVFEKYQFDINYKVKADYYLNLQLFADKQYSFVYIRRLICYFNDGEGFSKSNTDFLFERNLKTIVKDNYSLGYYLFFRVFKFLLPAYSAVKDKFRHMPR